MSFDDKYFLVFIFFLILVFKNIEDISFLDSENDFLEADSPLFSKLLIFFIVPIKICHSEIIVGPCVPFVNLCWRGGISTFLHESEAQPPLPAVGWINE